VDIYIRRQNHEDVSMAPGGREQVRWVSLILLIPFYMLFT